MHFVVETISEFTYFENILLGLGRSLKKCVGIRNTTVSKFPSVSYSDISAWEQKYGVLLPEDLRLFYTSSNGFLFQWTYTFGEFYRSIIGGQPNDLVGKIRINPIERLLLVYGYETCSEPGVRFDTERYQIKLAIESKIFELDSIPNRGRIVLIYLFPKYVPTVWLLASNMNFFFLANDISTYLRMAVAHLGIPNWQFAYSPQGVPQCTENVFRMLAPHLLPLNKSIEKLNPENPQTVNNYSHDIPMNKLNPNLFKILPRTAIPVLVRRIPSPEQEKPRPIKKKMQYKQMDQTRKARTQRTSRKPLHYVKTR
ncbi:hypothetical protein FQA39_LY09831 [Lamprigera yunnana]|nr:hypothetical protein FQA39_LY09831 [Lamprigera yunnana]